jgi:hypothetical protein
MTREEKIASIKSEHRWFWAYIHNGQGTLGLDNGLLRQELLDYTQAPVKGAIPVRVLLTPVLPAKRSGHHRKAKP